MIKLSCDHIGQLDPSKAALTRCSTKDQTQTGDPRLTIAVKRIFTGFDLLQSLGQLGIKRIVIGACLILKLKDKSNIMPRQIEHTISAAIQGHDLSAGLEI